MLQRRFPNSERNTDDLNDRPDAHAMSEIGMGMYEIAAFSTTVQ